MTQLAAVMHLLGVQAAVNVQEYMRLALHEECLP